MSWQVGLILVVTLACIVPYVIAAVIHDFGTRDDSWDATAERKRQIAKRAKIQSGEFR